MTSTDYYTYISRLAVSGTSICPEKFSAYIQGDLAISPIDVCETPGPYPDHCIDFLMGGRVANMCDPVCDQDAATKYYVDHCSPASLWKTCGNYLAPCDGYWSCGICIDNNDIKACAFYAPYSCISCICGSTCVASPCIFTSRILKLPVGTNCY